MNPTFNSITTRRPRWPWAVLAGTLCGVLLFGGCLGTPAPAVRTAQKTAHAFTAAPQDGATSTQQAAHYLTRIAIGLIAIGLIFAAVTRLSTGLGVSIAAAGLGMLLLAWTVEQWWVPWLSLLTVIGYGGYWVTTNFTALHRATTIKT